MAGSVTSVALKGTKSVFRFIEGSWGKSVGQAFRKAHLEKGTSFFNFEWGKAYHDYFESAAKAATEAASKPAATGFWASIKNGLGKIPGMKFIGKNWGPMLMFGPMVYSAVKELFNGGGIGGALKELTKGAIGWAGWGIGTMLAFAFGATGGIPVFLCALAVSSIAEWGAKAALGPSMAERQEELAERQKQYQEQHVISPNNGRVNMDDIDRQFKQIQEIFNNRNDARFQPAYNTNPIRRCYVV